LLILHEEEAAGRGIDTEHGDVAGGTIDVVGRVVAGRRGTDGGRGRGSVGRASRLILIEDI